MQDHGVGSDLSPEQESLYSPANQRRAREGQSRIRPIVWRGACAMLPGLFLPQWLWPDQSWGSLLGMGWCFGCGLEVAWRSYRCLLPSETSSRASLWSGGLLLLGCGLAIGLWPQLLLWLQPANLKVVVVVVFVPMVFLFYAGLWMLQLFPAVASLEGRGWRQDALQAIKLLSGSQLQVLGALLAATLPVSFLSILVFILFGILPSILSAVLATHLSVRPPVFVMPLFFALCFFGFLCEFALATLSCSANLYQQLKGKTISPA